MPEPLTSTEQKVYYYLLDFLTENTYQPSVREIGRRFRIKSTKTVSEILQSLARKGYIERDPSRSRGVRLLGYEGARRTVPIPVYSEIAPGETPLLPENRAGFITMDRRFVPNERVFCIRAGAAESAQRGILPGDYVIVDPASPAGGDIVCAGREREGTVRILPQPDGGPPAASAECERVLGRVCGVFRPYEEREEPPSPALE